MSKQTEKQRIEEILEPIIDDEIEIIKVLKDYFTKEHCQFLATLLTDDD